MTGDSQLQGMVTLAATGRWTGSLEATDVVIAGTLDGDLRATGKVEITSQNHGFCVDMSSLDPDQVELTHINPNDATLEGMRHRHLPIYSVQYHPEASPGPHDAQGLFAGFLAMMKEYRGD